MQEEIKMLLRTLLDNNKDIPDRFWRITLWLNMNRVGITRNGHFVWYDNRGDTPHKSSWKKFFVHHGSLLDQKEAMAVIQDYMMILKGDTLTAREIIRCRNVEIRQFLMSRFSYERFLKELGSKTRHKDPNTGAELLSISMGKNMEKMVLVRVIDSTSNRPYLLRVPPEMRTCQEAIAWTFGLGEDEYEPLVET
nr:hypothetical protein [Candidatus Sigynarchaeota archaeon]